MSGQYRLAVFGGSFDPIHNGHIALASALSNHIGAQRTLFIPTFVPVHKSAAGMASGEHRLAMCRLALQALPPEESHGFEVSAMELEQQSPSYTVITLRRLAQCFPNAQLYLLCGADMFVTLTTWREWQEIFERAVICTAPRGELTPALLRTQAKQMEGLGARTLVHDIPVADISSTQVRRRAAARQPLAGLVPYPVEQYIYTHGLYRTPEEDRR